MRCVLELRLVENGESVTGTVRHDDGRTWPVDGWLDLLRVLEAGLDVSPAEDERSSP